MSDSDVGNASAGDSDRLYGDWLNWVQSNLGRDPSRASRSANAAVEVIRAGGGYNAAVHAAQSAWAVPPSTLDRVADEAQIMKAQPAALAYSSWGCGCLAVWLLLAFAVILFGVVGGIHNPIDAGIAAIALAAIIRLSDALRRRRRAGRIGVDDIALGIGLLLAAVIFIFFVIQLSQPSCPGCSTGVTPCGISVAEVAGSPGLWSWDGSTWSWLANEPPPGPRVLIIGILESAGIAYDPDVSGVLAVNETGTHLWDGSSWQDLTYSGPSRRVHAQLVYDPARHVVVLFGGGDYATNGTYLNDTWTWDGKRWHQQTPSSSPDIGLLGANLVWDNARQVVLLFGGMRDTTTDRVVSATWAWDGSDWHQLLASSSPPTRSAATMAFDSARGTAVLYGGSGLSPEHEYYDTWTWDGTTWKQQSPAHEPTSPAIHNGQMCSRAFTMGYDPVQKVAVLVTAGAHGTETWTWDGSDWTQRPTPIAPPAIARHMSMTYDTHAQRVLLVVYAGH